MKRPPQPLASTCLLMLAMCTSIPAHSAPPDAGQASRELQPRPELTAPTDRPGVRTTEEADPRSATQSGARVFVRSLRFRGNQAIASSELEALLAYLAGGERSFGDLQRGVSRVTALYRQRGFPVARALLPPQNVLNDEIEIQVLEGELGQTMLSNRSRVSDASAMPFLNSLRSGDAIETPNVERALQLLGDLPGVGAARATLQPGASVGTADLLLELEPAQAYLVQLEADNYGNRYVGEYRVGATIAWNSPLEQGDLLTLRALTSGENLNYLRAAYQLPLGGNGLQGGAAYADTRYRLGEEFASLQQRGAAYSKSLFMSYPLVRSRTANASASLTWEDKALIDESAVPGSGVEKRLELLTLEGSGNRLDGLGGGGQWAFHVAFASGTRAMDAASRAQDAAVGSAHTHGGFNKITYALQRAQRLGDDYSLVATLSGQQAGKNLNSSEKFSLGGAQGVRAYPQGEGSGDEGLMLNLELRRRLTRELQAFVFYDAGTVDINRTPFELGANTRTLEGAGLGLLGQFGSAQLRCVLAWPTSGGDPVSDTARQAPRLWFQFTAPL